MFIRICALLLALALPLMGLVDATMMLWPDVDFGVYKVVFGVAAVCIVCCFVLFLKQKK